MDQFSWFLSKLLKWKGIDGMKYIFGLILLFTFLIPAQAEEGEEKLALVIEAMDQCYEVENQVGADLAKCIRKKLEQDGNPQGYLVNIFVENLSKDVMSNITVTVYNKSGLVIVCYGKAQHKIQLTHCTGKQEHPFSKEKMLSIEPPISQ